MHMNQEGKEYTNHPERYSYCVPKCEKQGTVPSVGKNYGLTERSAGHVSSVKCQSSFAKYPVPGDKRSYNDYMVSCNHYQSQDESYGLVMNTASNPCIFHTKAQGLNSCPVSSSDDVPYFPTVDYKEEEILCSSQYVPSYPHFNNCSYPNDNRAIHISNSCFKDNSVCSSKFISQFPSFSSMSQSKPEAQFPYPSNENGLSSYPCKHIYSQSREFYPPLAYPPSLANDRDSEFFSSQLRSDIASGNQRFQQQPLIYPSYPPRSYPNEFYTKPEFMNSLPMNEISNAEDLELPPCHEMENYKRSSCKQPPRESEGFLYDSRSQKTTLSSSTSYLPKSSHGRTLPSSSEPLEPLPSSESSSVTFYEPVNPLLKPYPNEVDVRKLQSGEETRTCVMIRNIPNKYRREDVVHLLYSIVKDHFSVTSFPLDMTTGRNLGYCFVRFDTVSDLIKAYNKLAYLSWPNSDSVKTCRFCFAREQSAPPPHVIVANRNRSTNQNEKKHAPSYSKHY